VCLNFQFLCLCLCVCVSVCDTVCMRGFESRSSRYLVMLSILPCSSFRSESRCSLSFRLAFIKNETKETYRYENSDFQKLKSDVVKISLSLFVSLYESLSLPLSLLDHTPAAKKESQHARWLIAAYKSIDVGGILLPVFT